MLKILGLVVTVFILTTLSGCSLLKTSKPDGPPPFQVDVSQIPDPVPHRLAQSHFGNPSSYVALGKRYYVMHSAKGYHEQGIASWYGMKFHGHRTSSGEPYDMLSMTAASRTLPIPVFARVTNLENGRSVIVKVNDRGPFAAGRIIDLSYVAAKKLGYAGKGTARVDVQALTFDEAPTHPQYRLATAGSQHKGPRLFIQVGAFRQQRYARDLQIRLKKLTHQPVLIETLHFQKHPIYRVQIGPLKGSKESGRLQHLLKRLGLANPVTIIG